MDLRERPCDEWEAVLGTTEAQGGCYVVGVYPGFSLLRE